MLKQRLREIIPNPNSTFPKLESGDQYYFDQWGTDLNNEMCLYYWFWDRNRNKKNKKRVVISEVEELIRICLTRGQITRDDFRIYCPVSESAGPCGFAVTVRMLEYLGIGQYLGRGLGFEIGDGELARSLMG
ncbi:MAG: hypothetical protein QMD80_06375 [archaeon]|nr:hypothetical protein [archaeon]